MADRRLLRLIRRARRGEKNAFCELVNLKGRSIVYLATNLMGNRSDGEDAAQEAVIALARNIGKLKKAELFDAWMYRIIFNVCMDAKRKRAKMAESSAELEDVAALVPEKSKEVLPEEMLHDAETREDIMAAINELPERYRLFVLLHYYEEMSYAEIASAMQVSEQVVANTLNRARQKMRENFIQNNPEKAYTAHKQGALFSAVAISQAIAFNEQAMVLPDAISGVTLTASIARLIPASLLLRFFDSSVAKSVAGVVCAALLAIALLALPKTPVEEPEPAPGIVSSGPSREYTGSETFMRIVTVVNIPADSIVTVLEEGLHDEALQAFEADIDKYHYVTELTKEGYHYILYQNNEDTLDYVVTAKKIEG